MNVLCTGLAPPDGSLWGSWAAEPPAAAGANPSPEAAAHWLVERGAGRALSPKEKPVSVNWYAVTGQPCLGRPALCEDCSPSARAEDALAVRLPTGHQKGEASEGLSAEVSIR